MVRIFNSLSQIEQKHIEKFETDHNIKLPESYKQFLLRNNGGRVKPDEFRYKDENISDAGSVVNYLFGICADHRYTVEFYIQGLQDKIPSKYLPIGNDIGSNLICLDLSDGAVYLWNAKDIEDYFYFIAEDIDEFLNKLTYLPE